MTREQIIATLKDIKSATAYIDGVVHEMSKAIEELPVEEPEPQHLPQRSSRWQTCGRCWRRGSTQATQNRSAICWADTG